MGSLFVVTVPTRQYETLLRQKENKIQILMGEMRDKQQFLQELEKRRQLMTSSSPGSGSQDDIASTISAKSTEADVGVDVGSNESSTTDTLKDLEGQGQPQQQHHQVHVYRGVTEGATVQVMVDENEMVIYKDGVATYRDSTGGVVEKKEMIMNEEIKQKNEYQERIANTFLEKHMDNCLKKFDVENSICAPSGETFYQFSFTVPADLAEPITDYLQTVEIGKKYESSIWVGASSFFTNPQSEDLEEDDELEITNKKKKSKRWGEFVASIKSRLTVAQVVQSVKSGALLTFDYLMLVIVAAIIAGLGLIDDSAVNVVASMLVSPLMGPIMAGTFGAMIRDRELIRIGVVNELIGLSLCLLVGFSFGILLQVPHLYDGAWSWKYLEKWPTPQMSARGQTRGLRVGLWVAIPSGVGVALSILAGNSGSLVGVAISASLLPPAVNCGIFLGMCVVILITEASQGRDFNLPCNTPLSGMYTTNNYTPAYCENVILEYLWNGLVSFGLTTMNIVVIFIVGLIVLKIKEVAPHTTKQSLERFWKEDIKAAREANWRGKDVLKEIANASKEQREAVLKKLEFDPTYSAVHRRAAYGNVLQDLKLRRAFGSVDDIPTLSKLYGNGGLVPAVEEEEEEELPEPPKSGRPSGFFSFFGFGGSSADVEAGSASSSPKQLRKKRGASASVN